MYLKDEVTRLEIERERERDWKDFLSGGSLSNGAVFKAGPG